MKYLLMILIPVLLLIGVNIFVYDLSSLWGEESKEAIFEAIQKDEYLRPHYTYESSIANFASKNQCIRIKRYLHKGEHQSSKTKLFNWVIDIPVSKSISNKTKQGIAELDALVAAELLSKEQVTLEVESIGHSFNRYRLTTKGWAESIIEKRKTICIYLGRAKHLSVKSIKESEVPISRTEKESAYEVTTIVGFPKNYIIPNWANHPDVKKAFPLIDQLIEGYEKKILMEKSFGQWREYLPPSKVKRMEKSGKGRSAKYLSRNEPTTTKEVMLEAITEGFQEYAPGGTLGCIRLPGEKTNTIMVDRNLTKDSKSNYSVAIYENRNRRKWDLVEIKTKPYLDRLVSAGLLESKPHAFVGVNKNKKDVGQHFEGTLYQLAPEYEYIFDQNKRCIYLGEAKMEIVKLDITVTKDTAHPLSPEIVNYKYIVTYPTPPDWVKDKALQAWWPELKGAIKYGKVCDGTRVIDFNKENKFGAYCHWAFNSIEK